MIDIIYKENLYITNRGNNYGSGIVISLKDLSNDQLKELIAILEQEIRIRGNE